MHISIWNKFKFKSYTKYVILRNIPARKLYIYIAYIIYSFDRLREIT